MQPSTVTTAPFYNAAQSMAALLCTVQTLQTHNSLSAQDVRSASAAVLLCGSNILDGLSTLPVSSLMAVIDGHHALNIRPHAPLTDELARLALGYKSSLSLLQLCKVAAHLAQLADVQHVSETEGRSAQCAALLHVVDKELLSKHNSGKWKLSSWPALLHVMDAHARLQRPFPAALEVVMRQWLAAHIPEGTPLDVAKALRRMCRIPRFSIDVHVLDAIVGTVTARGAEQLPPPELCQFLVDLESHQYQMSACALECLLGPLLEGEDRAPRVLNGAGSLSSSSGHNSEQQSDSHPTLQHGQQHPPSTASTIALVWGAVTFGLSAKDIRLHAAVQRSCPLLARNMAQLSPAECVNALWSFVYCRCSDTELLQELARRSLAAPQLAPAQQYKVAQSVQLNAVVVGSTLTLHQQQALRAAIVAWQRMKQEVEQLLQSVIGAVQALQLGHYMEESAGLPLLRLDFGNYRNVAVLPVPAAFCSQAQAASPFSSDNGIQEDIAVIYPLGIFQVAYCSALARGLHCAPLSLERWGLLHDTSRAAQYLLQQLLAATSAEAPGSDGKDNTNSAANATGLPSGPVPHSQSPRPTFARSTTQQYTSLTRALTHTSSSSITLGPEAVLTPTSSGMEAQHEEEQHAALRSRTSGSFGGCAGPVEPGAQEAPPSDTLLDWQVVPHSIDHGVDHSSSAASPGSSLVGREGPGVPRGSPQHSPARHLRSSPASMLAPSVFQSTPPSGLATVSETHSTLPPAAMLCAQNSGFASMPSVDFVSVPSATTHMLLTPDAVSLGVPREVRSADPTVQAGSPGARGLQPLKQLQGKPDAAASISKAVREVQQMLQERQGEGSQRAQARARQPDAAQGPQAVALAASPFQLVQLTSEGDRKDTPALPARLPADLQGSMQGGLQFPHEQLEAVLSQLASMSHSGLPATASTGDIRHMQPDPPPAPLQTYRSSNTGTITWNASAPTISNAMQQFLTQQQSSALSMLNLPLPQLSATQSMPIGGMAAGESHSQWDMSVVKRVVLESADSFVWTQLLCSPSAPRSFTAADFLALLRELVEMQQVVRARQLFEWSRMLPASHAIRQLNSADEYSTLLMLCVQWQSLDHAVALLNEMHHLQLPCGVREYVSLLRAASRSNRLEMVMLLYKKMLAAPPADLDYTPFHLIMEAYLKVERFQDAVDVLRDIERCNMAPDLQSYNTVLAALCKAGRLQQALQLYGELRLRSLVPNVKTFLALTPAFASFTTSPTDTLAKEVDTVILTDAISDQEVYMALLGSCEKAGQWTLAIHLLNRMSLQGCPPTKPAFNSLIAACAHAGEWRQAEGTLKTMVELGCMPDAVSYASMIRAYKKGSQWCSALFTFESMLSQQLTVHSAVYSSVIDLLWQTCNPWAQSKAKQLFAEANRTSAIPVPTVFSRRSVVKVEVHALAAGTALLAVLQWLMGLHEQLQQGMAGELLGTQKRVAVSNGDRSTRGGQSSMLTAIRQLLESPGSPFRYVPDPHAGRLEATTQNLKRWLLSPAFNLFVHVYNPEAVPLASKQRHCSTEQYLQIEQHITQQTREAYSQIARQERLQRQRGPLSRLGLPFHGVPQSQTPGASHVTQLLPASFLLQRPQLLQYTHSLAQTLGLPKATAYAGCAVLDIVMLGGVMQLEGLEPVVVAACLATAAQRDAATSKPLYGQLAAMSHVDPQMVAALEAQIHMRCQQQLPAVTAYDVLQLFWQRLDVDPNGAVQVVGRTYEMLGRALLIPDTMLIPSTVLAAAVLVVARKESGAVPLWPSLLAVLTGYTLGGSASQGQAAFGAGSSGAMDLTRVVAAVELWLQGCTS